jgi:hypothetical protein
MISKILELEQNLKNTISTNSAKLDEQRIAQERKLAELDNNIKSNLMSTNQKIDSGKITRDK